VPVDWTRCQRSERSEEPTEERLGDSVAPFGLGFFSACTSTGKPA
jgi:hypothetical protein